MGVCAPTKPLFYQNSFCTLPSHAVFLHVRTEAPLATAGDSARIGRFHLRSGASSFREAGDLIQAEPLFPEMHMRQLLLNWGTENPQTLENFVTGRNEELAALLRRISEHAASGLSERFVYLWGESGAGKTHLLRALTARHARYLPSSEPIESYLPDSATTLYLLDDCECLSPEHQIAAFALYNHARDNGASLVAAGASAPGTLPLRDDLRTRLGWGLIYQVHGLSDDEKIAALTHSAQARGLSLSPGVIPYLITHFRRDMPSLSAMLDALDSYSLETQRPITLPLLRELLQLETNSKN
jgi:DnaA family protein